MSRYEWLQVKAYNTKSTHRGFCGFPEIGYPIEINGDGDRIRTCDRLLRRPILPLCIIDLFLNYFNELRLFFAKIKNPLRVNVGGCEWFKVKAYNTKSTQNTFTKKARSFDCFSKSISQLEKIYRIFKTSLINTKNNTGGLISWILKSLIGRNISTGKI